MSTAAQAVGTAGRQETEERGGGSFLALVGKLFVALVAIFALASPVWVLFHGMSLLNQAPPPYWNMHAGHAAPGQARAARSASFGGC